jgi:hypothetical protein
MTGIQNALDIHRAVEGKEGMEMIWLQGSSIFDPPRPPDTIVAMDLYDFARPKP